VREQKKCRQQSVSSRKLDARIWDFPYFFLIFINSYVIIFLFFIFILRVIKTYRSRPVKAQRHDVLYAAQRAAVVTKVGEESVRRLAPQQRGWRTKTAAELCDDGLSL
jgi:hypothetical protein